MISCSKEDQMDIAIRELFLEEAEETPCNVDMEAVLNRAYAQVESSQKKKKAAEKRSRRQRQVKAAVVFLCALVFSLLIFEPDQGYADMFRVMFDRSFDETIESDNLIDDENQAEVQEVTVDLNEIDDVVGFHIPLPEYIPDGYEYDSARMTLFFDKMESMRIYYFNKNKHKIIYHIMMRDNKKTFAATLDVFEKESESIEICGKEGTYYRDLEREENTVYWEGTERIYSINGKLDKEELIKMAESME